MYSNIGKKIQGLAKIFAILGIITCVVIGGLIIQSAEGAYRYDEIGLTVGIVVIALGSILSWIFSFVLYGFGRLVENSDIIARQYRRNSGNEPVHPEEPKQPMSQTIRNVMDKGAIAAKTIYDKSGEFIGNQAQKAQARRENAAQQPQQYAQRPTQHTQRPVQPAQTQINYDDLYSTSTQPSNSQKPADTSFANNYEFLDL